MCSVWVTCSSNHWIAGLPNPTSPTSRDCQFLPTIRLKRRKSRIEAGSVSHHPLLTVRQALLLDTCWLRSSRDASIVVRFLTAPDPSTARRCCGSPACDGCFGKGTGEPSDSQRGTSGTANGRSTASRLSLWNVASRSRPEKTAPRIRYKGSDLYLQVCESASPSSEGSGLDSGFALALMPSSSRFCPH